MIKKGTRFRLQYFCDILFDNGQFEEGTPYIRSSGGYNIRPSILMHTSSTSTTTIASTAAATTTITSTAPPPTPPTPSAAITSIVETTYVPKVGDRVDAHSKGFTDDDHTAVYPDWAWYPGKITKVNNLM